MLFLLALIVAEPQPNQILAGRAFTAFASRTDRICATRRLRFITPGDLSGIQEDFTALLSPRAARRLAEDDRQDAVCGDRGGLACPTTQTLAALGRVGLLDRFARFACARPPP